MRVTVIGANGQLGTDVVLEYQKAGDETTGLTHADVDICSVDPLRDALCASRPEVIVNTAAMHHVEDCEKEPLRAYEANALGVRNLARVANELKAKLVHISTDYVFDGLKCAPYVETDYAAPLNVYGNTKLAGEAFLRGCGEKWFVLRTSAIYGKAACRAKGRNFVQLMVKLASERDELRVVDDEIVSPTSTTELARQVAALSRTDQYGLYHATSEGSCSWYEFACAIFQLIGKKVNLQPARPNEFPSKVPRPKYSVLENEGLKNLGLNVFRNWQEGLQEYLATDRQLYRAQAV